MSMAGFAKRAGSPPAKQTEGASSNETKKKPSKKVKAKVEEPVTPKKAKKATPKKGQTEEAQPPVVHKLYTLKFNSPILPFAKFPLT
jgi:hypothetical protein